jgi:hypothetical protein
MVESQDFQAALFPDEFPLNVTLVDFELIIRFGRLNNFVVTVNEGAICVALNAQDV